MPTITTGLFGGEMHGVAGNAVFVRTARGTVVRDRTIPRDPQTPAQRAVRAAKGHAARAWKELEPETAAAWARYAAGVGLRPMNAFSRLYEVLLRLDASAPVPLAPPARPFFGDVIAVEIRTPSSKWLVLEEGAGGGGSGDLSPQPPLPNEPSGEGEPGITFFSSGANAPGVVTELLIQPLASRHRRTYLEKYRHAAYVAFATGETVAVPAPEGWVACGYRFVNARTGQVTAVAELGVVRAG